MENKENSTPKKMRISSKPNRPNSLCDHHVSITSNNNNNKDDEDEDLQMREEKNDNMIGRERLKRHRDEMSGKVFVPEKWGFEDHMKDWIDHSSFDKILASNAIRSAREALVLDSQKSSTNSQRRIIRIKSRC